MYDTKNLSRNEFCACVRDEISTQNQTLITNLTLTQIKTVDKVEALLKKLDKPVNNSESYKLPPVETYVDMNPHPKTKPVTPHKAAKSIDDPPTNVPKVVPLDEGPIYEALEKAKATEEGKKKATYSYSTK